MVEEELTEEQKKVLGKKLGNFGNTVGFSWLLREEGDVLEDTDGLPILESIISSEGFIAAINKFEYLKEKISLDDVMIKNIATITTGQVQNEKWYLIRKFRLTASNFGAILSCCRRNKFPKSLFKTLMGKLYSICFY